MLKEYLAELQKTPLLSREEEAELWQRYASSSASIRYPTPSSLMM